MRVRLAQLAVGRDLDANLRRVTGVLAEARPGELVVFPEGMISGYEPADEHYSRDLDATAIEHAIEDVLRAAAKVGCRLLVGSATRAGEEWRNTVLLIDDRAAPRRYHKRELSRLDRRHFGAGPAAGNMFAIDSASVGVVACRELLFPAVWKSLKDRGAQIIVHLNNAIQPQDAVWIHLLIARAIELGVFVCSVNNGAAPQALPSVLVAPSGRVIVQTRTQQDDVQAADIDLAEAIRDLHARTDF